MIKHMLIMLLASLLLAACGRSESTPTQTEPTPESVAQVADVILMLDWVPNVNHTGIFVAADQGYFAEAGLNVDIQQPGEVLAEAAVASGAAHFGVSFQEQITLARARTQAPLVSIAAIIQHNTSGFASRADAGIKSPADWGGLAYGSFGTEFEEPTLRSLMECASGDFDQLEVVNTGFADPLALLQEEQIDLAWIFYGTQGIAAEQAGIRLEVVMMADYFGCIPDYYTPILITSEDLIAQNPDIVRAFLKAVARGYEYAAEKPDEAAEILLKYAPESDAAAVHAQQNWLSPLYAQDAPRWGEQKLEIWQEYAQWMVDEDILDSTIDAGAAYTNIFLP
jgi:ABC-type nitrate/sulfonate/bicarbonate transport system substrate-binding protein